jgi:PPK2 family polyphosphate:nucleotide phosphotransferase
MSATLRAIDVCRVTDGSSFRLSDHPTDWKHATNLPDGLELRTKEQAVAELEDNRARLVAAQEKLWANDTFGVLVVFQAMDAAGKDGTIKHVLSGMNPQGVTVASFKVPTPEELDHNYLWRYSKELPRRGQLGIFNRSYYEEVLVARVHPEVVDNQRLPETAKGPDMWKHRYEDIVAFERHLVRNGIIVVKFFLHLSKEQQRLRFLDRIDTPEKNWKFSVNDVKERERWDDYQVAYEEAIRATATPFAPWYVVPADRKWRMRTIVSDVLVDVIDALPIEMPRITEEQRAGLAAAREQLLGEAD